MDSPIPKKIFFDFFEGKATSLQHKLLEEWLADSAHEAIFYQYLNEWESKHPQYFPDTEQALQQYTKLLYAVHNVPEIEHKQVSLQPLTSALPSGFRWWRIAAAAILVLSIGLFYKPICYQTYRTGNAQTMPVWLADGTLVTLNANSTLSVPRWTWMASSREVMLRGEAEFQVMHTPDERHFVVKTGAGFEVEVLGTEFVVYARGQAKKVVLNRGKIQLHYEAGKQLTLKPGDVATLARNSRQIRLTRTAKPQLYSAWKHHQYYFDQTPLSEVATILREQFGHTVVFEDSSLAERRLAGYFKANSSREIIDVLTALLNLSIEQQGNTIIIHKQSSVSVSQ